MDTTKATEMAEVASRLLPSVGPNPSLPLGVRTLNAQQMMEMQDKAREMDDSTATGKWSPAKSGSTRRALKAALD